MRFDELYKELNQSTEIIRTLLTGITLDEARKKPDAESWSMLELLCHLYDEEREDFREHLAFIINRNQEEWHGINPGKWVTERKYNDQDFVIMQDRFFSERDKSLDWLKNLSTSDWNMTFTSKWGKLSAGDMFVSWIAHDNLAIRQFVELRRRRIEDITKPYSIQYAGDW